MLGEGVKNNDVAFPFFWKMEFIFLHGVFKLFILVLTKSGKMYT